MATQYDDSLLNELQIINAAKKAAKTKKEMA